MNKIGRVAKYVAGNKRGVTAEDVARQFCIAVPTASGYLHDLRVLGMVKIVGRKNNRYLYRSI